MLRNVESQKWRVFAWDRTTGAPKTGDAANISAYITKDDGTPAATNDAAPTEVSSTNEPGYYDFDLTQAETAAAKLSLAPKSSTSNISVVACPPVVYTRPQYFSVLGIESDGHAHADVKEAAGTGWNSGAIGSATIAADAIGSSELADSARDKIVDQVWRELLADHAATAGSFAAALDAIGGAIAARLVGTIAAGTHNAQSGDAYALVNSRLTSARAGYLDNLNVGGAVASQADINALNQSASRRIILQTVGHYERPESGSTVYTVEARTFDGDGVPTNADSTPTLAATGQTSGDLSANLGAATNPATGVYRWTYTVDSGDTVEPVRFDVSATIGATAFPMAVYTQIADIVSATWTSTHAAQLAAIYNKLPSKAYLTGTANSDGDLELTDATGTLGAAQFAASALNGKGDWATSANVLTQATAALVAIHLDHLFESAYDPTNKPGNASGLFNVLVENDAGVPRFTANALEQAPAGGGGGGGDWTADELTTIRAILGIPGSGTTPATPTVGVLRSILDNTASNSRRTVYIFEPVISSETVEIVRGDSYATGWLNGPLEWTVDADNDLTGATPTLTVRDADNAVVLAAEGTITDAGGGSYTIAIELSTAETDLTPGEYSADLEIAEGANVATPRKFRFIVLTDAT